MLSKVTLALGLAGLSSALGGAEATRGRCGAPSPSDAQMQAAADFARTEADSMETFRAQPVNINTYFHVIASSDSVDGGYLTDKMIQDQMSVLNEDYAPSGFQFTLANTTRTINPDWARLTENDPIETDIKAALRQGSYSDLNLYFYDDLEGVLGYCYFPVANPSPEELNMDGCSIIAASVPGGSAERYNLGKTATHEVGHWLGLFHTFQGGCRDGDGVADTPAQESESRGCPVGRDSCPGAGVDPIHNYMDYSDDPCLEEFTPGQWARMHSFWSQYRS